MDRSFRSYGMQQKSTARELSVGPFDGATNFFFRHGIVRLLLPIYATRIKE